MKPMRFFIYAPATTYFLSDNGHTSDHYNSFCISCYSWRGREGGSAISCKV